MTMSIPDRKSIQYHIVAYMIKPDNMECIVFFDDGLANIST